MTVRYKESAFPRINEFLTQSILVAVIFFFALLLWASDGISKTQIKALGWAGTTQFRLTTNARGLVIGYRPDERAAR